LLGRYAQPYNRSNVEALGRLTRVLLSLIAALALARAYQDTGDASLERVSRLSAVTVACIILPAIVSLAGFIARGYATVQRLRRGEDHGFEGKELSALDHHREEQAPSGVEFVVSPDKPHQAMASEVPGDVMVTGQGANKVEVEVEGGLVAAGSGTTGLPEDN